MKGLGKPDKRDKKSQYVADLGAGLTTALVTVPDGMASAILAGVNPIYGLNALMVGTPIAALTTSSQFMYVANTGALAVAVGSALAGFSGKELAQALVVLTLMVGAFQVIFGLLRLGGALRFVSNAVLTGFMTGIALNIILGQLGEFAGYHSHYGNKVAKAVDLFTHLGEANASACVIGLATVIVILILERTRLNKFNMILAMLGASLLLRLLGWDSVYIVADVAEIPRSLPSPVLPDLTLASRLAVPALAVAIIGLVQAAGVSKGVPNPDGEYSDASRDFLGQGLANLVSGFFQGMPIGGTMSETSVNVNAGAKSRWAIVFSALFIIAIVLLLAPLVAQFPMPAIAALLIVAGYKAIDFEEVADVWEIGWGPRMVMVFTFLATMALPVQSAVFLGVGFSVLQYLYQSAQDTRVVELTLNEDGEFVEHPAPEQVPSRQVTVLDLYGSLYFAAAYSLEGDLPPVNNSQEAVVILRMRGRHRINSTFIRVIERYAEKLNANDGKLMLAGVSPEVRAQIDITETTEAIPDEDIFMSQKVLHASIRAAMNAAEAWLMRGTDGEISADAQM